MQGQDLCKKWGRSKGKSEPNICAWKRLHKSIRTLRLLTTTTAKDKGMHTVEMHQKKMEDQGTLVLLLVNKIATDETTLNQNQSATIIKTPQQDASDACKTSTDPQETTTGTTETPPPSHHRNTTETTKTPPGHPQNTTETLGDTRPGRQPGTRRRH